jgi:hypothetical protein
VTPEFVTAIAPARTEGRSAAGILSRWAVFVVTVAPSV